MTAVILVRTDFVRNLDGSINKKNFDAVINQLELRGPDCEYVDYDFADTSAVDDAAKAWALN